MTTFGSVCSGIEAASVAWGPLGWHAAWFAEIEPFPSAVLAHHYPTVQNLGDMRTIAARILTGAVKAPDILCGGTPCQAFSVAGLRQSLADERGNLTLTFVGLADAIDHVRGQRGEDASVIFWENVPGVLSTQDNAFGCFLGALVGESTALVPAGGRWTNAGAVYGPKRSAAWRVLDAQYFGVAQRRRRVFVVASARDGFDPAAVLFEWDGVRRDTAPSREERQNTAAGTLRSTDGGCDVDHARAQHLIASGNAEGSTGLPFLTCSNIGKTVNNQTPMMAFADTTHTLRGEGFDASEDGTGRGTPLVPVGVTIHGTDPTVQKVASYDEVAQCLRARTPGNIDNSSTTVVQQPVVTGVKYAYYSHDYAHDRLTDPAGVKPAITAEAHASGNLNVAVPVAFSSKDYGADACADLSPTLRAMNHADSHANGGGQMAVAFPIQECNVSRANLNGTGTGIGQENDPMFTLQAAQPHGVATAMQVRRLTPRECERLQGFPETNFTLTIEVCEDEKPEIAPCAAPASAAQRHEPNAPVAAHVLIDCERMEVRQLKAGRFSSNAPGAEGSGSFRHPTLTADSVRLAALTAQCVEQAMRGGKAASLPSISGSSRPLSGSAHVRLSGRVIAELAGDAERLTAEVSRCMKFITSQPGPDSQSFASTLETSLCCVAVAIVSCIQKPTSQASSFAVIVETTTPYTLIPWRKKPASECPDGPRYKALGNSWAVPNVRWIGQRIKQQMERAC